MFCKTRHAAINLTVGEDARGYDFAPFPHEEGWYWGEVSDAAGVVLCSLGDFTQIGHAPVPAESGEEPEQRMEPSTPEPDLVLASAPTPESTTQGQDVHLTEDLAAPTQDEPKSKKKK